MTKEKERRKRKSEEKKRGRREKKTMVALLLFIMSYFGYSFWPLLEGKGPFHDNDFKNPARYIQLNIMLLHQEQKM